MSEVSHSSSQEHINAVAKAGLVFLIKKATPLNFAGNGELVDRLPGDIIEATKAHLDKHIHEIMLAVASGGAAQFKTREEAEAAAEPIIAAREKEFREAQEETAAAKGGMTIAMQQVVAHLTAELAEVKGRLAALESSGGGGSTPKAKKTGSGKGGKQGARD